MSLESVITWEEVYQRKEATKLKGQPLFISLCVFFHISPFLFSSLASDVTDKAWSTAVRSQLIESTWLTDKATENN